MPIILSWLSSKLAGPILGAALIVALLGSAALGIKLHIANNHIASLTLELARAKTDTAMAEAALSEANARAAKDAADATAKAQAAQAALQARINDLATQAAKAEQARQKASLTLLNTLRDLPHDTRSDPLSPSLAAYVSGLRDLQSSTAKTPH